MKHIEIKLTLRGLARVLKNPVKQAQPLTPEIMSDIYVQLDMNKRRDLMFWGILVIGFFRMLHKSNLVPDTKDSFDSEKQLTRNHITFSGHLVILNITWAKNIQFKEKDTADPLISYKRVTFVSSYST